MSSFARAMRVTVLLSLVLLLGTGQVWAQASTASLMGEVTDAQGKAIVGAKVTVTQTTTDAQRTTTTDSTGHYVLLALTPGKYELKVEVTGFRTAVRKELDLLVNIQMKQNVTMEVGQLSETVVVNEAASELNTTNASIGNVIAQNQITRLPMEGRSVAVLLSIQPGATYLPTGDMRSGSISGSRSDQSNITLDGIDINDPQGQTSAYQGAIRISQETLQEFRVTTTNYDATQGRSSAGQVAMVSKSGGNQYHGTAFWYHRNTATSSNEYFNKLSQQDLGKPNKPPKLDKHLFGGSGGGPIMKDRIFIFGSFEGNRQKSETVVTRSVPSTTFRDGILIYQCRNVGSNPACPTASTSVTGLSGTSYQIPAGFFGLSPTQFAAIDPLGIGPDAAGITYFRQFPQPNNPGRDGRNVGGVTFGNIMGFQFLAPLQTIQYSYDLKFDVKIDPAGNHTLFWRGTLQDDYAGGAPQFPGKPPNNVGLVNPKLSVIGYNAVLSPRLVNTFRYGYVFFKSENAGLRTSNASTFRFLSTVDGLTSSNARYFQTHNLVDDISWTRGNHTLQFGTNIRLSRLPRFTNAGSFHDAIANGSWVTGVGRRFMPGRSTCTTAGCTAVPAVATGAAAVWADSSIDLWGMLTQGNARYNYKTDGSTLANGAPVHRRFGSNEFEFYGQDVWRLTPNLTVTAGVRWSVYSPPWETAGNQVAPRPGFGDWFELRRQAMLAGRPSNSVTRISFDLAGPANGKRGFYDWDLNNFSPRFSVAWTPRFSGGPLGWLTGNGKMVMRGGYSLIYDRVGQALATSFDSGGSFGMSTLLTSPFGGCSEGGATACPRFSAINTVPGAPLIQAAPPGGFPSTPPFGLFAITTSIDDSNVTPYAHSINFSIGRELPANITVEASYVGRIGRKLLTKHDLAMPLDLVDPASKRSYFQAASALAAFAEVGDPTGFGAGTNPTAVTKDPYWENLYPGMIGNPICDVFGLGSAAYTTATMAVYDLYLCVAPDYTTALQFLDQGASPSDPTGLCTSFGSCSRFGPYSYFQDQYSSLAGQSTIGTSDYHAFQLTVRKRMSHGLQIDFNYALSKSLDETSEVERGGNFGDFFAGGYSEFVIDSWNLRKSRAQSTFDLRHQINTNWIYDLPFGKNRWLGKSAPGWLNQIIGDWSIAGLMRWTSGFPFNVINCRSCWPTNWNLQGNAGLFGKVFPEQHSQRGIIPSGNVKYPSIFAHPSVSVTTLSDPNNPVSFFRRVRPGETGFRNVMRGDGYYNWDMGLYKTFPITERYKLKFRWEVFNIANTVRFDTGSISATPDLTSSFGRYNSTLSTCDGAAGRCMQFALRVEF